MTSFLCSLTAAHEMHCYGGKKTVMNGKDSSVALGFYLAGQLTPPQLLSHSPSSEEEGEKKVCCKEKESLMG